MISAVPYLNFPGNSREAMTYYQSVFGGELSISSFGDYGMDAMPADGTMHAELKHPGFTIMASDAMPGAEQTWGGTRVYVAFMGDEADAMLGWYHRLAEDGRPGMPLEKQAWGDMYGDVMDKFGIEWMFNISTPQEGSQA
ncbi:MAG TPA: VOC family protein [Propionicimonas sp.]|nr:VOC family protein [Propionicimonas sp.]